MESIHENKGGARQESSRSRLILFTRFPEPGSTKTRLIPALGTQGASDLQRRMTEHAVACARQLQARGLASLEIRYAGGDLSSMKKWLGRDLRFRSQGRGDVGERMERAFREAFEEGAEWVVLVGSDLPDLTSAILERAFEALSSADMVIGPATDGGYYLLGLGGAASPLFAGVEWSTSRVLAQTLEIARNRALKVAQVETLRDLDRPQDLVHFAERFS